MQISSKGNYGLRAVLDLALHYGEGVVQSADIASRQDIPESYLAQLLNLLRNAGLVRSVRGPRGGHELIRRPEDITVGAVLEVLEGPIQLTGDAPDSEYAARDTLREVYERLEEAVEEVLASVTIGDLCAKYRTQSGRIVFRI
ncbi:MAG: Rrf2 family transcriptional regulator [Candidatus Latescibacteria bacterium]|nr:Rrf2 family transcriptional regulator [Candidatus Latescibacterota bacterium]